MKIRGASAICGFTLVEILVVVLIVSIMAGVVVTRLPRFAQTGDFDLEGHRLITLLDMAREESIVQSIEFGFKPLDEGYAFYYFDDASQKWLEYEMSPFQRRLLPKDIKLDLILEGEEFELGDDDGSFNSSFNSSDVPPLLLLSSGETTPFTLTLYQGDSLRKSMNTDGYGDIQWLEDDIFE